MPYIGSVVALLTLMFAMFKYFEGRMDKKFDRLEEKFDKKFERMDRKFDQKFQRLERQFGELQSRVFEIALATRPQGSPTPVKGSWFRKRQAAA